MRLLLAAILLLASCSQQTPTPEKVQHYRLSGEVVRLLKDDLVAVIKHETITDEKGDVWMDAMTMEFPVKDPKIFERLKVGAHIRARVNQSDSSYDYWIDEVVLAKP
ncbi:MAG: copper-binding protein [Acidobacteria bacterium]|nr:copper-binding protein [Acidobacteriota bacterium]